MKIIESTYISLLTDVGLRTRIPTIRGSAYEGLQWCVENAPKLDRELLDHVEHGTDLSEAWPKWLTPLRDRFLKASQPMDLAALRQLLLFCYKAEHKHTDESEAKAVANWQSTNTDVSRWVRESYSSSRDLISCVRRHVTSVLGHRGWDKIVPFHGPGAVYESRVPKGKWASWYETIEACFPYKDYFDIGNHIIEDVGMPVVRSEIVARLTPVPKDSRGPRLICVHPAESIWIQQGLRRELEHRITRRRHTRGAWPRGHVNFDDQTINGNLALSSSSDKRYATIDLKEASDRLSDILVQDLFGRHYRAFGCCRAQYVDIAGVRTPIHAYAPMGNATTFPVQSLVFWAVCVSALEAVGFHQPSDCYVFGDDIIVPSECYHDVVSWLTAFGLVVNQGKSYVNSNFRESCGVDAFSGVDITPVRWKTTYGASGPAGLLSVSDLAQRLRQKGYWEASTTLYGFISKVLRNKHRVSLSCTNDPNHGGIAEFTENELSVWRDAYWHRDMQWYVSPILRLESSTKVADGDWYHLLSSLTSLERTGRSNDPASTPSRGARLNRGWSYIQ